MKTLTTTTLTLSPLLVTALLNGQDNWQQRSAGETRQTTTLQASDFNYRSSNATADLPQDRQRDLGESWYEIEPIKNLSGQSFNNTWDNDADLGQTDPTDSVWQDERGWYNTPFAEDEETVDYEYTSGSFWDSGWINEDWWDDSF